MFTEDGNRRKPPLLSVRPNDDPSSVVAVARRRHMIAAATGVDLARLLLDLLIVIVAARVGGELAERVRIPAVLGEIVAGVLIGPSVLGAVELTGERGVAVAFIAEIGVLLLLVQVGMEMDLGELGRVGTASLRVAVIGVVLPMGGGMAAGIAMGESTTTALFLGAALTATSVGITARVFGDLRALATTEARVVVGAAVADDVLGLVILTVVVKVVTGGKIGVGTVAGTLGLAVLFLAVTGPIALFAVPRVLSVIQRRASSPATVVVAAIVVTLLFAELADAAKLAFIIGAFMAGLGLGRSEHHERIGSDLGALGNLFIPVFFAQIGINADLSAMVEPKVLGLAAVLTVVGVAGKLAAGWGAYGTRADKLLVGFGMIPRGEVGLIFASIGLADGVLDRDLYGAVLVVVLVTTMITPPLLRRRLGRGASQATVDPAVVEEPAQGWVHVDGGVVRFTVDPPVSATVTVALATAALLGRAGPSADVLDWFGRHRGAELSWSRHDTPALIALLRDHRPATWRFLEVTGVLERALPEVAGAVHHRRADMHDLDPVGSLRFPVVEAVQGPAGEGRNASDELLVAAFAADVCRSGEDPRTCAMDLVRRLDGVDAAQTVADLVADAQMLREGARRPESLEQAEVLQLAMHLREVGRATRSFALGRAVGDLPGWQRSALREREQLVIDALAHPELTGSDATDVAAARLQAAQRIADSPDASARLAHAPVAYLLAHEPAELARQARLVEPFARDGAVRVAVSPDPEPDHWLIDVACADSDGLLARLAGCLTDHGLDVRRAGVATWPDGAVLDTFTVMSQQRPRPRELAEAMSAMGRRQVAIPPISDLRVEFDNGRLPWHTSCTVTGPDRRHALTAIATALAEARVVVQSASIHSGSGEIDDRFAVTDRFGRKLDDAAMARVRRLLAGERPRSRIGLRL